ncbi:MULTISPECIES: YkvI family membrane protein [unclassified Modestobacter]|uniref:YkvI family membrane protein n=1 Tax=unclassified Modestobacter TaxID=2643866 RepID=UPI0022AB2E4F|nr:MULTISPECIES: hypothetical protein [unclassified Modestobacter]MCZ2825660.1 hypothetical protein [Modestobacter sp. VKM Ac-2981]MCZ2853275.1 hypothetical protein [Modestobacter sp. VKM Ac-2982]
MAGTPHQTSSGPGLMGGRYGRYVLPAVVFQSVLIGGGYATGREVVQYGARFGVLGLWSIAAVLLGFALMSGLAYEFARTFHVYNYRSFMKALIGPFWLAFDVLFLIMVVIVIAVMAAAAGTIGEQTIGLPGWVGVVLVIGAVALFNFYGGAFIEKAKSVGTVVLYVAYLAFAVTVLTQRWGDTTDTLMSGTSAYSEGATALAAVGVGLLYVGYNLTVMPAVLFTLHRQRRRRDAVLGGLVTGVLSIIPFVLTYLCLLAFYPDDDVLGAEVPWLVMLQSVGGPALVAVFAAVVIFTLIETATGSTHAIVDRVDDTLAELGRRRLTRLQSALFTGGVVLAGALLSQVGIIALVAQGYTLMAYGFIAVFAVPLLTIGVWRIVRAHRSGSPPRQETPAQT